MFVSAQHVMVSTLRAENVCDCTWFPLTCMLGQIGHPVGPKLQTLTATAHSGVHKTAADSHHLLV